MHAEAGHCMTLRHVLLFYVACGVRLLAIHVLCTNVSFALTV